MIKNQPPKVSALCFLTLFNFCLLKGQERKLPYEETKEKLERYFQLPREQLYVHINKSAFIKGETLWFKAYVYDLKNKKPSVATTNVELGVYNEAGRLVKKKLFYAEQGHARGQLELDSLFTSGIYFVRATTHWLKNFKENHDYVQAIRIIDYDKTFEQDEVENPTYDLQFMPEGGHLVEGLENNVGYALKGTDGKGVPFDKGIVYDHMDKVVTTFKSNVFGLGSFLLNTVPNAVYRAEVALNDGTTIRVPLPIPKKEGLALRLLSRPDDTRYLQIRVNAATQASIQDKPFYVMYHQDGRNTIGEISFQDTRSVNLKIEKEQLWPGMNIVTILDFSGKPVAERLLFNSSGISLENPEIVRTKSEQIGDSIAFHFNLKNEGGVDLEQQNFNLSASVLPAGTASYSVQDNIGYSFLLKPYIKGHVENPQYYFEGFTPKKAFELDLLLLTQGWSRYAWEAIFAVPPEPKFQFQQGITLNASVQKDAFIRKSSKNNRNKKDGQQVQLYIHPTQNQNGVIATVEEDNRVFFNNLYFSENDTLRYSVVNPSGKLFKLKLNFQVTPKKVNDVLAVPNLLQTPSHFEQSDLVVSKEDQTAFEKGIIVLKEVVVSENQVPKKKSTFNPVKFSITSESKIDVDDVRTFPLILDLIRFSGFNVGVDPLGIQVNITSRIPTLEPGTFRPIYPQPIVFLDGARLTNFNVLRTMRTDEFETIYANPRDISYGLRGSAGAIRLTTRKTAVDYSSLSYRKTTTNFIEHPLDFSFTMAKKFYTPLYNNYDTGFFDSYGTIHWEPSISVDPEGNFTVTTIFVHGKKYGFYFEGMSGTGKLLSKRLTLEPRREQ